MKLPAALFALLLAAFLVPTRMSADSLFVVGTDAVSSSAGGWVVSSTQVLAQQFTIDQRTLVESLTVDLGGSYKDIGGGAGGFGPAVPVLVQLTDGIGPGSDVILESSFLFPSSTDSYQVLPFTVDQNRVLEAGTYYVVVSSTSLETTGYLTWVPGQAVPTSLGNVGLLYSASDTPPIYNVNLDNPNDSTFTSSGIAGINSTYTADFQLFGKPVSEPPTLLQAFVGLAVLGFFAVFRKNLHR